MSRTDPRYPIGRFVPPPVFDADVIVSHREAIRALPDALRTAVDGLVERHLDTPYRSGGWTVRQVVHHLADSHLNAYTRMRLGATEQAPTIRPYDEVAWAELPDARESPIAPSVLLLDGLHARWSSLLASFDAAMWQRTVIHPEHDLPLTLWTVAALYAWHGRHHVAHIRTLRDREGW
ncbi:MAG: YfiT family bacillithiol transferase [Gemmatimonadota bacterium]